MPSPFPALPDGHWPFNIRRHYDRLELGHQNILETLSQEDTDPTRLRLMLGKISSVYIPMLVALEQDGRLKDDWLDQAVACFVELEPLLRSSMAASQQREDQRISYMQPVYHVHTGRRGRPETRVEEAFLREQFGPGSSNSVSEIAASIGIDRHTLEREIERVGLHRPFSTIANDDLDELVGAAKEERPDEGFSYFLGVLRSHGFRVQQERVKASLRRVDPIQRSAQPPRKPRTYAVTRPNKVWHGDGYHKLIRWGFVIHGFADGYSRMIVGMKVHTNNRGETVLKLFTTAVDEYGCPSRARGDRGAENIEVAVWMIITQGPNRGSYLWGSSTRNTRIERLWLEVGRHFARRWRAFFMRLERLHNLDADNPHHIWLLHYLFLDALQTDCQNFVRYWNHHPIRTTRHRSSRADRPQKGNKSPIDMFNIGKLDYGVYNDPDLDGVHVDLIRRYYSVNRTYRLSNSTASGAGHSDNEDALLDPDQDDVFDSEDDGFDLGDEDGEAMVDDVFDMDDLERMVQEDQTPNLRHDPIEGPKGENPFDDDQLELFKAALAEVISNQIIPPHYGVDPSEWDDGDYPDSETILIAGKSAEIQLARAIWWPRAVLWTQGLEVMSQVLND